MEEERPHLVLLDLMLPGSDGIELMNRILKTADVPVIFVSMYGQDDVIVRAFDMGAVDYVVKPFSPTELAARIRAAQPGRAAPGRAVRTLLAGRPDHRLRRTPGGGDRASGAADAHRVRGALRAFGPRRAGVDPRPATATGLGSGEDRRRPANPGWSARW